MHVCMHVEQRADEMSRTASVNERRTTSYVRTT